MVRTRFAPSPTGFLHVGGLRAALYNFLFARKNGGKFLLRIEDTDQKRAVPGAVENLIKTLKWAGLEYDEGPEIGGPHAPYVQSQRTDLYRKYAAHLMELGAAYRCFCTAERLEEMRRIQAEHKQAPMYDRKCAGLSKAETEKLTAAGTPFVIRQNIRDGRRTAAPRRQSEAGSRGPQPNEPELINWRDLVRGEVSFQINTIDDQVLLKSDSFPTYHLANVVDDHFMEITHVIRGEEWLSSTPKHLLLYRAFGWQAPQFAHLPLLLNKDRSKLSKRQGDVAVEDYQKKNYLPEAMVNFIAFLGWHPGSPAPTAPASKTEKQEIFPLTELVEKFSLEKVHKAGAVFDLEKLDWMNWQWRRRLFEAQPGEHGDKLISLVSPFIPASWMADRGFLLRCLKTVEEKLLQKPEEAAQYLEFYFIERLADARLIANPKMKVDEEIAKKSLETAIEALEKLENFDEESLKICLTAVVAKLGFKNGQVFWPVRVALTGEQFSPGVFEVLWALGKEKSLARLRAASKNI